MRLQGVIAGSLIIATVLLGAGTAQAAPPPNDDFADATVVSGSSIAIPGTTVEATTEENEQLPSGEWQSVWYRWTAPSGRATAFRGCDDHDLDVYSISGPGI